MKIRICPICAGVSLTWLLILAGLNLGWLTADDWLLVAAIAMGGTVVGIAYQGEKRSKWAADNTMKFKVLVILTGFVLAYLALSFISWTIFWVAFAILGLVAYVYFVMPGGTEKGVKDTVKIGEIEEKLKNCC
ncbi:MAG TPA: hypothetical protein VJ046_03060 [Candidatus Paceibacterota bacterium]|nr:hypothetical protein [Candidatus Paceibacterota bacterium]